MERAKNVFVNEMNYWVSGFLDAERAVTQGQIWSKRSLVFIASNQLSSSMGKSEAFPLIQCYTWDLLYGNHFRVTDRAAWCLNDQQSAFPALGPAAIADPPEVLFSWLSYWLKSFTVFWVTHLKQACRQWNQDSWAAYLLWISGSEIWQWLDKHGRKTAVLFWRRGQQWQPFN